MTETHIQHIAGRKLAFHWIKLYHPERILEWNNHAKVEPLPGEYSATATASQFFDRKKGAMGYKLAIFIEAIDIRETRQLCLGESFPPTLQEEAGLLLKEAEELFDLNKRRYSEVKRAELAAK
jgi:hypothetical protein